MEASRRDLREGKGHQGPTDHYEVQNVPEVAEVGTLVQDEPQVDHLRGRRDSARAPHPTVGSGPALPGAWPPAGSLPPGGMGQRPEDRGEE